jgi:hypothetical protein
MFFVIYIFVYALSSCSALKADELNCETFMKENICNMTDEEAEVWFWEFFKSIMEPKEIEVEIVEV